MKPDGDRLTVQFFWRAHEKLIAGEEYRIADLPVGRITLLATED